MFNSMEIVFCVFLETDSHGHSTSAFSAIDIFMVKTTKSASYSCHDQSLASLDDQSRDKNSTEIDDENDEEYSFDDIAGHGDGLAADCGDLNLSQLGEPSKDTRILQTLMMKTTKNTLT
jgi:hypothetical protein